MAAALRQSWGTPAPQRYQRASEEVILNEIKACHSKSLALAAEAVSYDENRDKDKAMDMYLKAMRHSENGMRHEIHQAQYSGQEWDAARRMQEAMVLTLENVKKRVYELQSFTGSEQSSSSESPPPYSAQDPLIESSRTSTLNDYELTNAEPVLSIESGVQMYFVTNESEVEAMPPCYPTSLQILVLPEEHVTPDGPQAVLQVGDWVYPLARNQMPVLHSSNGAYVFPNCTAEGMQEGSAVGVVISNSVPRPYVEMFESVLRNYAMFQSADPDEGFVDLTEFVQTSSVGAKTGQACLSDRLSESLTSGAEIVGNGIRKTSEYATELVNEGSKKIHAKLSPDTSPLEVSPNVKKGLMMTYNVSQAAVKVTRWLVNWLCKITIKVGKQIGPLFANQSETGVPEGGSSEANGGFYKVASAGLAGFGKVWLELEKAGTAIAEAVTSATVKNVRFKYGPDAGQAANLAMGAAVNIGKTALTLDNLGMMAIAEASMKDDAEKKEQGANDKEEKGCNEKESSTSEK